MDNEVNDYSWLLKEYPESMNKEQLYKILHVSKRTALKYLTEGIIPCKYNPGKKTHSYAIYTKDVIRFMKYRDKHPHDFYQRKRRGGQLFSDENLIAALNMVLDDYPDLLTIDQVAEAIAYSESAICRWCDKGQLKHFRRGKAYYVPRVSLIEFMADGKTRRFTEKSCNHIIWRAETIKFDRKRGENSHNYYERLHNGLM